jgi:hypothetical protein
MGSFPQTQEFGRHIPIRVYPSAWVERRKSSAHLELGFLKNTVKGEST